MASLQADQKVASKVEEMVVSSDETVVGWTVVRLVDS